MSTNDSDTSHNFLAKFTNVAKSTLTKMEISGGNFGNRLALVVIDNPFTGIA